MQHQDPTADRHSEDSTQNGKHDPVHAVHDHELIAGLAAGDLAPAEHARAAALTQACHDCLALHDDLIAIARATRTLPVEAAPRDFRITAEQAARLRRTGWLAALLRPFGARASAARPLATAFTTLGLVGVFVAILLPGMFGGAALSAAPEAAPAMGAPGSEAPAGQFGPAVATAGSDAGSGVKDNVEASGAPGVAQGGQAGGGQAGGQSGSTDNRDLGSQPNERVVATSPTSLLLIGSLAVLATGLILFGLSVAGRRLR